MEKCECDKYDWLETESVFYRKWPHVVDVCSYCKNKESNFWKELYIEEPSDMILSTF